VAGRGVITKRTRRRRPASAASFGVSLRHGIIDVSTQALEVRRGGIIAMLREIRFQSAGGGVNRNRPTTGPYKDPLIGPHKDPIDPHLPLHTKVTFRKNQSDDSATSHIISRVSSPTHGRIAFKLIGKSIGMHVRRRSGGQRPPKGPPLRPACGRQSGRDQESICAFGVYRTVSPKVSLKW
jgi:hypothetical protein